MAAAVATATAEPFQTMSSVPNPKPLRVCFSYAAYAKSLIDYLRSSNIPVESGLSEAEFVAVEASFGFVFPPDLRSILREGLPVGPGFPNWRSGSKQQLEILINLPVLGICKEVSRNEFWSESWGDRPGDGDGAAELAGEFLKRAPVLVPMYRQFYIPATPCTAGNPVFYVCRGGVRLWSFDIAGFFQKVDFTEVRRRRDCFSAPAWAATEARRIEFWTEMAEGRGRRRWWSGVLDGCLEEVWWRLRDGGWTEEDVREMMMMDGGDDDKGAASEDGVEWRVRVVGLSGRLLRGGWTAAEVVELLGEFEGNCGGAAVDREAGADFHCTTGCDDQVH
ncbi:uncharacterized protein LOC127258327 [Andrographis paniculata]|uniref:uncharacterized protein LOC127258327 n=1 Tax=Andrographis paniculata TaxID=175694 RepID=UPI0021E6FBDE|nr:uncharacterized protein LOC127258327 [Andrographis paniculata]